MTVQSAPWYVRSFWHNTSVSDGETDGVAIASTALAKRRTVKINRMPFLRRGIIQNLAGRQWSRRRPRIINACRRDQSPSDTIQVSNDAASLIIEIKLLWNKTLTVPSRFVSCQLLTLLTVRSCWNLDLLHVTRAHHVICHISLSIPPAVMSLAYRFWHITASGGWSRTYHAFSVSEYLWY